MESKWFLFPGQTLANTKISDRSHALHITSNEWGRITKHLDRKKLIQEAIDKEEKKMKYLDEGSKSMIKNWENSLENIRKRKEEDRLQQIEQKKEERNKKFHELRKEQEKIRKEYVDKMKKQIFMNTGNARELTSAFVTSEIIYEREKQKKFKNSIKKHNEEVEAEYAKTVKLNAAREQQEKKEKEQKLHKENRDHGDYLKKIIEEKAFKQQQEKEKQIIKEASDNVRAVQELECIQRKLKEEEMEKKKKLNEENKKLLKLEEEKKIQMMKEEKELDDVVAIYQEAKHRIDCMKKSREKELQEEHIARRDAVAKLVAAEEMARTEGEEERLKTAIAEKDAIEEAKVKARAEYDEKMKKERIEDRKKFLERETAIKLKEKELKKWEMLNRYKTDEIIKHYEGTKKKEHWKKILEYKNELLEQMVLNSRAILFIGLVSDFQNSVQNEDEAMRLQEKEIDKFVTRKNFVNEDHKFFEYAEEVLELAKKKGRSTYPIEKVIMQYKKNQLISIDQDTGCDDYNTEKRNKSSQKDILQKAMKMRNCRCKLQRK